MRLSLIKSVHQAKNKNFNFRGLLFTSHWLNLQHWTGFYIAVYGDFQGLFFFFEGSFFAFRGRFRPEPPPPPPPPVSFFSLSTVHSLSICPENIAKSKGLVLTKWTEIPVNINNECQWTSTRVGHVSDQSGGTQPAPARAVGMCQWTTQREYGSIYPSIFLRSCTKRKGRWLFTVNITNYLQPISFP